MVGITIRKVASRNRGAGPVFWSMALLVLLCLAPDKACASEYVTPPGYNDNDYQKLVAFLQQPGGTGGNGDKIKDPDYDSYDPANPDTWGGIEWGDSEEGKRVVKISWDSMGLTGSLDLSGCKDLQYLYCSYNQLESLDVSGCEGLQILYCSENNNQLESLNVSGCEGLHTLLCQHNQLESLDVSDCESLEYLMCFSNILTSLDLGDGENLQFLWCSSNELTSLDLSGYKNLQGLRCYSNELTSLDLSGCSALQELDCSDNKLTFSTLTLPLVPSDVVYTYSPQENIPIGAGGKIAAGEKIDLSAEARIGDTYTVFTWYDENREEIIPTTATNGVFTFGKDFAGQTVYCEMTNDAFQGLTLKTDKVQVVVVIDITEHPGDTTVKIGDTAAFSVEAQAAGSGEGGTLSYQWQLSRNGGKSWEDISDATTTSYTTPEVSFDSNGHRYRCKVTNDMFGSNPVCSNPAVLSVVANPSITGHPQDATVIDGDTATFTVVAETADAGEGGELSYQWQLSTDGGKTWEDISDATTTSYTTPEVAFDNGYQYRCGVTNTKNGVSSDPVYSNAATLRVQTHKITFIKPTEANDENNPVNINSGSLVLASISGDISTVDKVTIKVDDHKEQALTLSGNTIYYLLPANLSTGWHTITIKLTNAAGQEITETVTFYWHSYRRGFGFGRFDFGEAPAEE
ncbi:MAG TPA: leucine-rich repeat domain-containing protein [Firmicutes bacterium]|nr:leucine-rich repeat domain-containing protein [Bacillota bacterium]